jgi:hypothetical protein
MGETARLRLLVTVKAYPSISTKYNELVCCAGVTPDNKWVRLYPVPYRDLPEHKQFQKYDIIEVTCERRGDHKDNRPESWCPRLDTVKFHGHINTKPGDWSERLQWIEPSVSGGFAEILREQEAQNKSLGAFRPKEVLGIEVTPEASEWSDAQIAAINQGDLFSQKEPLEKVPFRFRVGFLDELDKEHWLSVIDWEFFQLWRKERNKLGSEAQAAEQVRKKLEQVVNPGNDLVLFVGNLANPLMRKSFMILGCCWPKLPERSSDGLVQGTLF